MRIGAGENFYTAQLAAALLATGKIANCTFSDSTADISVAADELGCLRGYQLYMERRDGRMSTPIAPLASMTARLKATGVYRLAATDLVYLELCAYQSALSILF